MDNEPKRSAIFRPRQKPDKNRQIAEITKKRYRFSISIILLIAGLVLGGTIIGWIGLFPQTENIQISLESVNRSKAGNVEMTGASYSGTTQTGVKFIINAERVSEDASTKGLVRLYKADGTIESADEGITNLISNEALYSVNDSKIELIGNVNIHQKQRDITLSSEKIIAYMGRGEMHSDTPILLTGPNIKLSAESMQVTEFGDIIMLSGKSTLRLGQKNQKEGG